ncbi:MAG: hypothetical protein A2168_06460 [Planctomycetes bacterium RBG_13_50_24]|nr:MAG: hypothetical protein A2168_06460 [Planctomycetes bacterium RBG_13_50_24]
MIFWNQIVNELDTGLFKRCLMSVIVKELRAAIGHMLLTVLCIPVYEKNWKTANSRLTICGHSKIVPLYEREKCCPEGSSEDTRVAVESKTTLLAKEWEYGDGFTPMFSTVDSLVLTVLLIGFDPFYTACIKREWLAVKNRVTA